MDRTLTVELSETAYAALSVRAKETAQSPVQLAAAALEERFGDLYRAQPPTAAEKQAARERFERHFGAVNLCQATGADNEAIDAGLAREYADNHEGS